MPAGSTSSVEGPTTAGLLELSHVGVKEMVILGVPPEPGDAALVGLGPDGPASARPARAAQKLATTTRAATTT
jgi:hypothetical protein